MLRLIVASLLVSIVLCQPIPKSWPPAWNATVYVTMSDTVIGAATHVYYDSSQLMQVVNFTQCAVAGGAVLNEPCTMVQSSQRDNFGIWTIFNNNTCCINFSLIGYLPPTWPTTMTFVKYIVANGKNAIHFTGGNHEYYVTNDANQTPIFVGPEEWNWINGWNIGPQDLSHFEGLMPIARCNSKCISN